MSRPRSPGGIARQLEDCEQCPLCELGTAAVAGEGPADARLVIVGEQPGDRMNKSELVKAIRKHG